MICSIEKIIENVEISESICRLSIKGNFEGKPGQFYMLKLLNGDTLLPRPISIHDNSDEKITFLYHVAGKGTKQISKLIIDDEIQIMGPLGNGFDLEGIKGRVALVAGGIGIAPMQYLTKELSNCSIDFYAGFRDIPYGLEEIEKYSENVFIATESGRVGHKGYIISILEPEKYDLVICCGPKIMMDKVINMCKDKGTKLYVSMESRMACGIGACLGCTCKTIDGNKTTCKTGPVFLGEELVL
ncbi:MAG: dihydroorotate dehydrogenase electron transfer subunit [Clostridium sp.]